MLSESFCIHSILSKMFIILSLLVSLLLGNNLTHARLNGEGIVGGDEVKFSEEYSYLVNIYADGIQHCGGGIIGVKYIITAAHCVINTDDKFYDAEFVVVAGESYIGEDSDNEENIVKVNVTRAFVPVTYNGTIINAPNDIAILMLEKKLPLGYLSLFSRLHFPRSTKKGLTPQNSYAGFTATLAGYGQDEMKIGVVEIENHYYTYEKGSASGKLRKAKVRIVSNEYCKKLWPSKYKIDETTLCGKVIQKPDDVLQGFCNGDSGAPLVYSNTVIGIVSYNAFGCNETYRPAVYTRVSAYLSFIKHVLTHNITEDIRRNIY